jgi:hypothetical protein
MLQVLFGILGTLATMLGVWVAWRISGGMVIRSFKAATLNDIL